MASGTKSYRYDRAGSEASIRPRKWALLGLCVLAAVWIIFGFVDDLGSGMHGAIVLPTAAPGRLIGVVVMGERAGGEAYAPDEVEALSQFAHGVGSALSSLLSRSENGDVTLRAVVDSIES